MMAVPHPLGEGGDIARPHHGFPLILDQYCFPGQHDNQLVLALVPVALARPRIRPKRDMTRREFGQAAARCKSPIPSSADGLIERRGIAGAVGLLDLLKFDFRHGAPLARRKP